MRRLLPFALFAAIAAPAHAGEHEHADAAAHEAAHAAQIAAALASPARDADKARDVFRHPAETLKFFQVHPDMKVGEYAPGGGWYSRVLAPYLAGEGKLVGLFFDPASGPFDTERAQGIRDAAAKFPADVAGWTDLPAEKFAGYSLDMVPDGEAGTFDRILVIRMMHNLFRWNGADGEIKAMRALLKDDGLLGIVQHRAKPGAAYAASDGSKGYLREADVINFMEINGFELVGKTEINANPKDTADHEGGVWELPPVLRTKNEALKAVGESDRMTLLFRKRS